MCRYGRSFWYLGRGDRADRESGCRNYKITDDVPCRNALARGARRQVCAQEAPDDNDARGSGDAGNARAKLQPKRVQRAQATKRQKRSG